MDGVDRSPLRLVTWLASDLRQGNAQRRNGLYTASPLLISVCVSMEQSHHHFTHDCDLTPVNVSSNPKQWYEQLPTRCRMRLTYADCKVDPHPLALLWTACIGSGSVVNWRTQSAATYHLSCSSHPWSADTVGDDSCAADGMLDGDDGG